jgi:molybdopterin-guanine dinucleotide biosynthesis protein A
MSKLTGLVVCGGKSSRMGKDKSTLEYHGQQQRYYLYEMLESLCGSVYLSCNKEQAKEVPATYKVIVDEPEYKEIGPMAALLSAFKKHPKTDFLVVGCDYPFIHKHHLKKLMQVTLDGVPAVAYFKKSDEVYEPLVAVYHHDIKGQLLKKFKEKNYSLERILKDVDAYRLYPSSTEIIRSVDTQKEYKELVKLFKSTRKETE